MNGSEIMLDAVNGIAPDLVDEAAGYRFKRNGTNALAWAAAACLMLGVGAAMAAAMLPKLGETPAQQQTAEATPVPTPDISAMRIIEGTGKELQADEEVFSTPGRWKLLGTLWNTALNEKNADSLFAVSISFKLCAKDDIQAQADAHWKPLEEAEYDPTYLELWEKYGAWMDERNLCWLKQGDDPYDNFSINIYVEYFAQHPDYDIPTVVYLTEEEYENYPVEATMLRFLNKDYVELPSEELLETFHGDRGKIIDSISEKEKEEYREAIWNVIFAKRELFEHIHDPQWLVVTDAIRAKCEKEAYKLIEKGYYIDLESMHISYVGSVAVCCNAYLTADQVLNFEPEPDEAYYIYFTSEEGLGLDLNE